MFLGFFIVRLVCWLVVCLSPILYGLTNNIFGTSLENKIIYKNVSFNQSINQSINQSTRQSIYLYMSMLIYICLNVCMYVCVCVHVCMHGEIISTIRLQSLIID